MLIKSRIIGRDTHGDLLLALNEKLVEVLDQVVDAVASFIGNPQPAVLAQIAAPAAVSNKRAKRVLENSAATAHKCVDCGDPLVGKSGQCKRCDKCRKLRAAQWHAKHAQARNKKTDGRTEKGTATAKPPRQLIVKPPVTKEGRLAAIREAQRRVEARTGSTPKHHAGSLAATVDPDVSELSQATRESNQE
jgi:hypothetical protein